MRLWILLSLIGLGLGWAVATNVGSAMALNEMASRPIRALSRDDGAVRIAVQGIGKPAAEGEARILGGEGILFGYSARFALPDGGMVQCLFRFRSLSCDGGWRAER
jgi:hypothetical protein